jgi:V8-like Glu-specific endopeptidase
MKRKKQWVAKSLKLASTQVVGSFIIFTMVALSIHSMMTPALASEDKVIYGEDNRVSAQAHSSSYLQYLSESVAGMVPQDFLSPKINGNFKYKAEKIGTLGGNKRLCPGQKFADEPTASMCTGFLIAPNLIMTAGHCVEIMGKEAACKDNKWVFDYQYKSGDDFASYEVPKDNVYNCAEVVSSFYKPPLKLDYAIIRLDRDVVGREPVELAKEKTTDKTKLVIMGHPSGLPLKIAEGAEVIDNTDSVRFTASVDSFQGNSGSPVFNAETGAVEGILVSGRADYEIVEHEELGLCRVVSTCTQDSKTCGEKTGEEMVGPAEGVTRVSTIAKLTEIILSGL